MYIDTWMIITIIIVFGICAIWNKYSGMQQGSIQTLRRLRDLDIINILETGEIRPGGGKGIAPEVKNERTF